MARGSLPGEELEQPALVEHAHAEALRLLELGARRRTRDHVVGLLRHRRRDLAAGGVDALGGLLAREVGQRPGEYERLAGQRPLARRRARLLEAHVWPQLIDLRAHLRVRELAVDELCDLRADALSLGDLRW